jgi:NAD(P)-dependent dehydrogenase (short-subunit alcohol dehydrogenase family)
MKIVLTGASSGIGRYLTTALAQTHDVWGIARNETTLAALQVEIGTGFTFSPADVSDWDSMSAVAKQVGEAWAQVDALICCAGVVTPIGPAMQADPQQWSDTVRVNLEGTFFSLRAFFHLLQQALPRAKVLCFSGGGATGPRPNFTAYASAKSGLVRLVENLAVEWSGSAVDINAIAPGAIATRMTQAVVEAGPGYAGEEEYANALEQQSAIGETMGCVTALVEYLLSPVSDGISGRLISALWDPWQDLARHKEELADSDIYTLRRVVPADRGAPW